MDRDLKRNFAWWMLVFLSLHSASESRLLYGSGAARSHSPSGTHGGGVQPQVTAVKRRDPAEVIVRPRPVVVRCHPDSMEVVVRADMFDAGLLVDVAHLRLGSDSVSEDGVCRSVPSGPAEFTIQASLMDCGTKLSSTKEKIIYSNVLVYSPEPSSNGLLRLDGATIPVECHYETVYAVDDISLLPEWVPFVSMATTEDQIDFSLQLMTADWQFERGSYTYFLGDPIHFEVSAIMGNHKPLRVFVDHCVATATPDTDTTLRYDFIEHHGCLADAYLTNSSASFLPRVEQHKLRFQIDAFRFYQELSNQVYITCYLSAVQIGVNVTSQSRACSFIKNRWHSVDGNNQDCRSCDISHRVKEPPSTEPPKTTISVKPRPSATSQDSLVQNRPEESVSFFRVHPGMHHYPHNKHHQSSAGLMKREAENKMGRTIQMRPLIVLPSTRHQQISPKDRPT